MYTEDEIEISKSNLSSVVSNVKEPVCLLGGWAVYITVNQRFKDEQGRNYIGSRDIDLGFHIDNTWSDEQLQNSAFSKSIKILKDMNYYGIGSRFVQHHDLATKKLLTEEEAKKYPKYEMFDLFVDPVVDKIHPKTKENFGLDPIDEHSFTDLNILHYLGYSPAPRKFLNQHQKNRGRKNEIVLFFFKFIFRQYKAAFYACFI